MIHGRSPKMSDGVGGKNLTARNMPDMLGDEISMKWAPERALKLPTISICIVFSRRSDWRRREAAKTLLLGSKRAEKLPCLQINLVSSVSIVVN